MFNNGSEFESSIKGAKSSYKLPETLQKLKLPNFSGKYSEFANFSRLFRTLVHDDLRLSVIEKFNHLSSCLTGPALRTIRALDFTEQNYETALSLLEYRFNNKNLMCQEHLRELFKLKKIQNGSEDQLRMLLDIVTAHFNSLSSLLSYEKICNMFVVHLTISALDNESLAKVEESVDSSKIINWSDFAKILTQRCQILEMHDPESVIMNQKRNKTSKSTALSASRKLCSCCNLQVDHPLWKCTTFLELTPVQRFEVVKRSSLCINCFSSQHSVRQCKSTTCKNCNSFHHTLLHRSQSQPNNNSENSKTPNSSHHVSSSSVQPLQQQQ